MNRDEYRKVEIWAFHRAERVKMDEANRVLNELQVLIVDDNMPSTELMHILLSEQGAYVQKAETGKDALLRVAERRPQVLITDIEMPDMDGWSLIHSLKSRSATGDIPIIVVSAYDSVGFIKRAINLGCKDYIVKPINPTTFVLEIVDILSKIPAFADRFAQDQG
jgi:CheY-like chemotaxis protein